jgi:hypothetical protein
MIEDDKIKILELSDQVIVLGNKFLDGVDELHKMINEVIPKEEEEFLLKNDEDIKLMQLQIEEMVKRIKKTITV